MISSMSSPFISFLSSIFILQFFMLFMVKNHPGHSK
jgi:hypothetical protein